MTTLLLLLLLLLLLSFGYRVVIVARGSETGAKTVTTTVVTS